MTIRSAERPLSRHAVVGNVGIALGTTDGGQAAVSIRPSGSSSGVQNITDLVVLDRLILELGQARQHLVNGTGA